MSKRRASESTDDEENGSVSTESSAKRAKTHHRSEEARGSAAEQDGDSDQEMNIQDTIDDEKFEQEHAAAVRESIEARLKIQGVRRFLSPRAPRSSLHHDRALQSLGS